jgi:hypothetical protein
LQGHDFEPEWLKLVAQMVHPETNSLLVLYDDAQSAGRSGSLPELRSSCTAARAWIPGRLPAAPGCDARAQPGGRRRGEAPVRRHDEGNGTAAYDASREVRICQSSEGGAHGSDA